MTKYVFAMFLLLFTSTTAFSQSKIAEEAYFDFKVSRNVKGSEQAIGKTAMLLKMEKDFTVKQVTNISYHLGRMYE